MKPSILPKSWLPILLAVVFPFAALGGDKAKDIVKKVRKQYEKIESLQTRFVQTEIWSLAGEEKVHKGTLQLLGKNKYRIETDTQLIMSDGNTVWTYSKDRDQAIVDHVSSSKEHQLPRDILLSYTKDAKVRLLGEPSLGGTPCYELLFTPEDEDAFIVSTRIWVSKSTHLALQIEQSDINENLTRYQLLDTQINPPLQASLFTFVIPETAEVVDLRNAGR